jgi:hypothetical protein
MKRIRFIVSTVIIGVYIAGITGITWLAQQFNTDSTIYLAAAAAILAASLRTITA